MRTLVLLAVCVAACSASGCKSTGDSGEELHVLPQSYKNHENYVLFGKLTACPREGEEPSQDQRFVVTQKEGVNVVLLNDRVGDFMYTPGENFVGIVTFWYHVEDEQGSSDPSTVTINVQPKTLWPSLDVPKHVIGLESKDIELDIVLDQVDQGQQDISVAICNCAHDVTCNRESEDCHCHLSLPDGWMIYDGDRQLTIQELNSLSANSASNLVLRAAPSSAAEHCLTVHVLDPDNEDDPSKSKKQMNIHIHPINTVIVNPRPRTSDPSSDPTSPQPLARSQQVRSHAPLHLDTTQGSPYVFSDLQVVDVDGVEGVYFVTLQLDQGGVLWIRQDLREDVVFIPLTTEINAEELSEDKVHELRHRFGTFRLGGRPLQFETMSNGVKILRLIGSLDGINEVLSTLTYVPWCSDWPTPPSWPLPERSWMTPSADPTQDVHHPDIWPQWYPRFWYPFSAHDWTWWPRVIPPWWISKVCPSWTSQVNMTVEEIPATTCHQTREQTVAQWSANISVSTSGQSPKSLVIENLFTYFQPGSRSVKVDSVYMRSLQYDLGMNVRFSLSILESNMATVEFISTGETSIDCQSVEQCNQHLQNIRVTFQDGVHDLCRVSLQVDMFKNSSARLGDRLVAWVVNTTRECIDVTAIHSDFELSPKNDIVSVLQGSVNSPLHLLPNVQAPVNQGILHVKVYAEHGLVTMKVPDGLRIYSDHMGQHGGIPTYLCVAGPVSMVTEALATARFTPFKPLHGDTYVTVEYGMPSTAVRLLFGEDVSVPLRSVRITIDVYGNIQPYQSVLLHPQEMCVPETASLPVNVTTILRRFREDEQVSFTVTPGAGSLRLNVQDKGLYECPIPGVQDTPSFGVCVDMCLSHQDCPETQMCCPNGCGHTCTQGQLKAQLQMFATGQAYMHGFTSTINQNILRNAIQFYPAACNGAGMDSYTDTISVRVIPARNPEGDSVMAAIPVHVTCSEGPQQVVMETEELVGNCEWSDWTDCVTEGDACGFGNQRRSQICNTDEINEIRSCLNCTCAPVPSTIVDPFPSMRECSSVAQALQCPEGCSLATYHTETLEFSCQPTSGEANAKSMSSRETSVRIHDSCVCQSCVSYHH